MSFNNPDLFRAFLKEAKSQKMDWIGDIPRNFTPPRAMQDTFRAIKDFSNKRTQLWKIVLRHENPFIQENALLALGSALLRKLPSETAWKSHELLSLRDIRIVMENWEQIQNPDYANNLDVEIDKSTGDRRLRIPSWCDDSLGWMYTLGRILRSAVTGEQDFTITPFLGRQNFDGYSGMQNSWYKRRMGMLHTPEALTGLYAPLTPWIGELLMRLLQWPGLEIKGDLIKDWDLIQTPRDLEKLLSRRLKIQKKLYGVKSNLPFYGLPVAHELGGDGDKLRLVIVQTLVPKTIQFAKADITLDDPAFRRLHNRHLSSIATLIWRQLHAQAIIEGEQKARADLIVFPELSVHPTDQQKILERLSDVTGAMIFAGMTYQKIGPKCEPVNNGRWIIPNRKRSGRNWIRRNQGKHHLTSEEQKLGVIGKRPCQWFLEIKDGCGREYRISAAICYDATDLSLAADLRDVSDMFIVSALNKDVKTFDNMVAALHYHMYQHIVLVNSGEFGGSTIQAPFKDHHEKLIVHLHGQNQIGISIFDVELSDFGPGSGTANMGKKKQSKKGTPAGYRRHKIQSH
ncbi:MAG: hypothetical protein HQL81_08610 [Magnetococcales bacterium]|nr:hypothetical protein [Magnetococcales bacterium]